MRSWSRHLDSYHDTDDQLRQHIWERSSQYLVRQAAEKDAISTVADFEKRRARVKQKFQEALGGLPSQRPLLNIKYCGVVERPDFRIEKLIYESLPSFHVTANLYVPTRGGNKHPAVLFLSGHLKEAKAAPVYQSVCRALARAGFVVLAIDPPGQGERMNYYNNQTGKLDVDWGVTEHTYAGFQCHLVGSSIARYFAWDGIRGIDLLAQHPLVDPARIGVTGNSGGGTQTNIMLLVDDRIAAAVSCCYLTERQAWLRTGKAHDAEQNYFGALSEGINNDDTISAIAPRPVQLGAAASDYFPIEGVFATFSRVQRIYGLYGAADNVRLVVGGGQHGFSPVLQREAVTFFRRHLMGEDIDLGPNLAVFAGPDESPQAADRALADLPQTDVEEPQLLNCTASGQLLGEYGAATRTVFDMNRELWQNWKAANLPRKPEAVRHDLETMVRAQRQRTPIWVRCVLDGGGGDQPQWRHVFFFSEPGVAVAAIELRAIGADEKTPLTLVVGDDSSHIINTAPEQLVDLLGKRQRLLLFDVRGSGAIAQRPTMAENPNPKRILHSEQMSNYNAMMLGDSLFAMRAFDVDRAFEYARRIAPQVSGWGKGASGLYLLAAAALRQEPIDLLLADVPLSWEAMVQEKHFAIDARLEVFGVLRHFDVDDLQNLVEAAGGSVQRG